MSFELLLEIYVALLGLVIGSYLNVVIYRLPRRLSTVLPRSRCPRCRAAIRAWDNVPVLSYLLLRGRCRHCGVTISWRYPLIEIVTGLCFVASYHRFETPFDAAAGAAFCAAMIALAMIDLDHYLLPDAITLPGIAIGLGLQPWLSWSTPVDAVVGALFGAAVLTAVSWAWYLVKGTHGMGLGDVKMLAMIGAFLGWQGAAVTLLLASLSGALTGAALMLARRLEMKSKLPFGFFLALGAVLTLFFGRQVLTAYLEGLAIWP